MTSTAKIIVVTLSATTAFLVMAFTLSVCIYLLTTSEDSDSGSDVGYAESSTSWGGPKLRMVYETAVMDDSRRAVTCHFFADFDGVEGSAWQQSPLPVLFNAAFSGVPDAPFVNKTVIGWIDGEPEYLTFALFSPAPGLMLVVVSPLEAPLIHFALPSGTRMGLPSVEFTYIEGSKYVDPLMSEY
jgi:hypothetical protein